MTLRWLGLVSADVPMSNPAFISPAIIPPPPQYLSAAIGFMLQFCSSSLHGSWHTFLGSSCFCCRVAMNSLVLHGGGASGSISLTMSWIGISSPGSINLHSILCSPLSVGSSASLWVALMQTNLLLHSLCFGSESIWAMASLPNAISSSVLYPPNLLSAFSSTLLWQSTGLPSSPVPCARACESMSSLSCVALDTCCTAAAMSARIIRLLPWGNM